MQKISADIDNDRQTPQPEIYSLMKILKNIPQAKQYERLERNFQQSEPSKQLTQNIIEQLQQEILNWNGTI